MPGGGQRGRHLRNVPVGLQALVLLLLVVVMVVVVMVASVVLATKHALLVGVAGNDARRRRRGEVGVGHVVGPSVQGQGRLGKGVQALRGGVRAAQAAEQRVFHGMRSFNGRVSEKRIKLHTAVTFHCKMI